MSDYFIDRIMNSDYTKVTMNYSDDTTLGMGSAGSGSIIGYLIDDTIATDTKATFTDLIKNDLTDLGGKLGEILGGKTGAILQFASAGVKNLAGYNGVSTKPAPGTVLKWDDSDNPTLDFGLLFVHTENDVDKPEKKVVELNKRCLPRRGSMDKRSNTGFGLFDDAVNFLAEGVSGLCGMIMTAPMGYAPSNVMDDVINNRGYKTGQNPAYKGTWNIKIGKWLLAPNMLLQNSSFDFSKECAPDGSPLYAQGKVSFIPFMQVMENEYEQWFINK